MDLYVAHDREQEIEGAPMRTLPPIVPRKKLRFGTIGYGLDLPRLIWSSEHQVFSSQDKNHSRTLPRRPTPRHVKQVSGLSQLPISFLRRNPVDVLLAEESSHGPRRDRLADLIQQASPHLPSAVILAQPGTWAIESTSGERRKSRRKRLEKLGYTALEWLLQGTDHGGALEEE